MVTVSLDSLILVATALVFSFAIWSPANSASNISNTSASILAIGKGGHNIRLAGRLCGFEIDVYRETDTDLDDVDLEEFADEIDSWIIDELKSVGCDTARSVLDLSKEELVRRTDLEEETVDEVLGILRAEFE